MAGRAGLATIPFSSLRVGSVRPLGLTLPLGSRPNYWRKELLYRACDIEDALPTAAQRYDGPL